jgi:hypothetical protein
MRTDQLARRIRPRVRESAPAPELSTLNSQLTTLLDRQTIALAPAGLESTDSGTATKKRAGREATLRRFVTAGLAVRERRVRGQGLANTDRNGPLPETRKRGRAGKSGRAVHEPGTEKS